MRFHYTQVFVVLCGNSYEVFQAMPVSNSVDSLNSQKNRTVFCEFSESTEFDTLQKRDK